MKFPEECLRSCLTVCRTFTEGDRSFWTLHILMFIAATVGFILGQSQFFSSLRQFFVSPVGTLYELCEKFMLPTRHEEAARVKACSRHSCLIRTTSVEKAAPSAGDNGSRKYRSRETIHTSKTEVRSEGTPPETSPQSETSSASRCSLMREKLSPLLVGSRKSTPRGSALSSLENSPVETYKRSQRDFPDTETGSTGIPSTSSSPEIEAPATLSAQNETASVRSSPKDKQHTLLSGSGTLPAAAWMAGKDAVVMNLQSGFKWLDLVELSLEAIYGEQWCESVHPDDLLHCKDVIALAQSVREPFQMEYRLKVNEETYRWVLDIGKPRFSAGPESFLGYVGWRIDIHERKTIENNYWKYWVLPHEFLVNWSGDSRYFKEVSPAFPCFLGYTMEEFLAVPWMDLVHEDDKASTEEALAELKEGKAVSSLVNRFRCKGDKVDGPTYVNPSGTYKWLNWTASETFAACRDITADKLAQEALKLSQQELRRITDAIPGGIFLYRVSEDGEESFPYVSKGALDLLGCELNVFEKDGDHRRILGMKVHTDDCKRLEDKMKQALDSQSYLDLDYRILKGGKTQWIRMHAVPRSSFGCLEWSGIGWDITEQHLVVDALKEARDTAEKAAQAKGKFLAHMSHEIRTSMNAVIGMGALLLETDLTDEQREYASTIRTSGEALLGIINDILDYSKVEAGKMELELQPMEILQCVESSFDQVVPQAALKSLELAYTVSEILPSMVLADSARIRQILVNLLTNAVKFTNHGCISVNVDGHIVEDESRSGNAMASYRGPKTSMWEIQFSVSDCGIGIPDDRKASLFQAFTQVDASTTRRYGGTGLGLAICARLSSLHGGRIWVENNFGGGSVFHFTILAEEERPLLRHTFHQETDLQSLYNKRVLIVAGSSSNTQTMCARFLKSWHMRPVCTSSSGEALKLLQKMSDSLSVVPSRLGREKVPLKFDAVIFDCSLLDAEDAEVMECLEMCHTILQTLPTLLLTPFGRRTREYYCGKQPVHFDSFISKPIKESHLFNALVNLLVQVPKKEEFELSRGPSSIACERGFAMEEAANPPTTLSDVAKMYPLRILVAEDNLINQKVILKLLLRLGYSADVVANGREALDFVIRRAYDVILMDCFMPEMDGLEATRRIRESVRPSPTIVAVTAAALEEEMQACLQAGMHMYISKPIQSDELMQTLTKCWHMKHVT